MVGCDGPVLGFAEKKGEHEEKKVGARSRRDLPQRGQSRTVLRRGDGT